MDKIKILALIILALLIGGCAGAPGNATGAVPTLPATPPTVISTPEIAAPTETPTQIPPTPTPGMQLPHTDQAIFTLPNPEPWSGREGDPRPDWLGWGAETFAAAPDGTFWIADSAASPHRLLHFSAQGELLQQVSLAEHVIYPYYLVAAQDSLWVLDISGMQPRVVQFSLEGAALSQVDIPAEVMMVDGMPVDNAAFSLRLGEAGELWLNTLNGYFEMVSPAGEVVAQAREAFSYGGHTYAVDAYDAASGRIPIYVDEVALEMPPDFYPAADVYLGFNPDGSFALAGYVNNTALEWDAQVLYFTAQGELLGAARQYPQLFYKDWNHHLAFGPDGSIYQLVSSQDHQVQIIRLGFSAELPPVTSQPIPTPTQLAALLPSDSPTTDEAQARNTLLGFFASLSAGEYAQAAALFGGEIDEMLRQPLPDETPEAYWEYLCTYLWCLPITEISSTVQVSVDEYLIYAVFIYPDGSRFELGACCGGDPAAHPPVWQFAYPVRRIDGVWKVMRSPLFTP